MYIGLNGGGLCKSLVIVAVPAMLCRSHGLFVRCSERLVWVRSGSANRPSDEWLCFSDRHLLGGHYSAVTAVL